MGVVIWTALGVGMAAAVAALYGHYRVLPAWLTGRLDVGFGVFPTYRVFLVGVGAALSVVIWAGIERTTFGASVRAAVASCAGTSAKCSCAVVSLGAAQNPSLRGEVVPKRPIAYGTSPASGSAIPAAFASAAVIAKG